MRNYQLYNENCIDVMKRMGDETIQLTVTSPPYDDIRNYGDCVVWNDRVWRSVIQELYRVTKPGGVVVWVVSDSTKNGSESGNSFRQALFAMQCGYNLHDTMIYHKDNPVPVGGHNRYYNAFEYMFVWSKGSPVFNPLMVKRRNKHNDKRTHRIRGVQRDKDGEFHKKLVKINERVKRNNVWTYVVSGGVSSNDKIAHQHPAIFPEQLAEDHILTWSNPGDIVFDPFTGSGTTGKMAILNDREFFGAEINSEYFQIAKTRIDKYAKLKQLF